LPRDWLSKPYCQTVLDSILDPSCSSVTAIATEAFSAAFKFVAFIVVAIVACSFSSSEEKSQFMV
jgi:hypothetical protein